MSDQIDVDSLDTEKSSDAQLAREIASDEWSRVSPIAILYFFVKTLFFLVNNVLIYMLPIFAFNLAKLKEHPLLFTAIALLIVFFVLIASIVKYLFYFYRLSVDRVEIRQGLINKSHLDLPFSKIQNVKIIQPFYYRFSTFSIMELDTAGSAQQEANIVAIRLDMAESFKQKVLAIVSIGREHVFKNKDNISPSSEAQGEILLNQRSIKDLIIHGMTNNRVWIFLGFLAPFFNAIAESIGSFLTDMGLDISSYLNYESQTIWMFALHLISIAMLIILFIVLFSIIASIFVFYDYRLSRSDERYIRRSGLFTKHEISMKVSRIQRAVQQQDWLDIIIGKVNLQFEQNSSGPASAAQAGQMNSANKLIVPSVDIEEADALVQDVFSVPPLSKMQYQHISPRYIFRLILFPYLPLVLLLSGIGIAQAFSLKGWFGIAGIVVLLIGLCTLRWYRWGFTRDSDFLYIRRGLLGRDYIVFPISKMQQSKFIQTPFMRARKLATLQIVLASGGMTIPYLLADEARCVIDDALLRVARDKPAWM